MSTTYPWIKDSKDVSPPENDYLAITSPNGLYSAGTFNIKAGGSGSINLTAPTGVNINGSAYPPTIQQVLTAGNSASDTILLYDATHPAQINTTYSQGGFTATDTTGTPEYQNATTANSITLTRNDGQNIGISPTDVILTDPTATATMNIFSLDFNDTTGNHTGSYTLNQTLLSYNSSESQISLLAAASPNILIARNNAHNTITLTPDDINLNNGGVFSSATWANIISYTNSGTPTLAQVLSIGNSATNSINLNNLGTGSNYIRLLPNASSNNPEITLTDGTTTNTIDKNGYTTRNTSNAGTYYLNFSDASATGVGSIQKTAGIECNASTKTITATTFSGDLSGTATNATNVTIADENGSATFYPVFASTNTGNLPLKVDKTTGPLTYVPSTGILTSTTFVASAASSTNTITSAQIAVANSGGSFTINLGGFTGSPTSNPYVFNGALGLRLQYNGTNNLSTTTNGTQATLLQSQGTATYSSPTLTLVTTAADPYPTMYTNLITIGGSTSAQTISAITVPTNMPVNGMYMVYITNNNTSAGAITVNATSLGTGIKTTYTTNVVIPISGFALGTLTKVGASTYIWSINLVA